MRVKHCQSKLKMHLPAIPGTDREFERNLPGSGDWNEETAVPEAGYCLGAISCESCDLCRLLCPDLCVTRDEKTGKIEIDYNFCKGCGICAAVCPKGAITMVAEEYENPAP